MMDPTTLIILTQDTEIVKDRVGQLCFGLGWAGERERVRRIRSKKRIMGLWRSGMFWKGFRPALSRSSEHATKFLVDNHRVIERVSRAGVYVGVGTFYLWLYRKKPEIMDVEAELALEEKLGSD